MTKDEAEKILEQIKPMTGACNLELVDVKDDEIKLKLTCPDMGIFKVKGKIIDTNKEIRKQIEKILKSQFGEIKIKFV